MFLTTQEDDSLEFVNIIMSDIIDTLDLETICFENNSEPNVSKRYQQQRCYLRDREDSADVRGLLNEMIDNLDLTHKRYKFEWPESPLPIESGMSSSEESIHSDFGKDLDVHINPQHFQEDKEDPNTNISNDQSFASILTERRSSELCVHHTLDQIFGNLKLEDSYCISEPSSDTFDPKRSVYFVEKSGELEVDQKLICALHTPPIPKGSLDFPLSDFLIICKSLFRL